MWTPRRVITQSLYSDAIVHEKIAKIKALLLCIGKQIKRIRKNENTELCDIVKLFYCALCSKNGSDICLCPSLHDFSAMHK